MKNVFRAFSALILLTAFVSLLLSSCGGNGNIPETDKEEPVTDGEESLSLEGTKIVLLNNFATDTFFGYKLNGMIADELIARVDSVSEKLNFVMDIRNTDDPFTTVRSGEVAAKPAADIVYTGAYPLRQMGNASLLTDIEDVSEIINYKDSFRWGNYRSLELLTCKGVLIGVQTASWIDHLQPYYFAVITNNDILAENDFTSPHEYDEKKQWTRSVFSEMVFTCADTSRGIYGFETAEDYIYIMSVLSDGLDVITEADDGTYSSVWNQPSAADNLKWAYDFVNTDRNAFAFTGQSYTKFTEGSSALCMCDAVLTVRQLAYADAVKSFSVIRFPCSDNMPYGTCGGLFSTNLYGLAIPLSVDEKENSAYVMNELFAPMDNYQTAEELKNYYTENIFFDSRDTEQLFMLGESASYDYWVEGCWDGCKLVINNVMKGNTPASSIEKYINSITKTIEREVVPNKDGLKGYFDD